MSNLSSSERKKTIVMWAPITLEPPISGDKINEVERIRVLSRVFTVYAFVLVSLRKLREFRMNASKSFGDAHVGIVGLPWLNIYGARIVSTVAASMIAALGVFLITRTRKVDLVISRGGGDCLSSVPLLFASRLIGLKFLYNVLSVPFAHREIRVLGGLTGWQTVVKAMKWVDNLVLSNADYVGVASPSAIDELLSVFGPNYEEKIVRLPFPIPDHFFGYPPRSMSEDRIQLVYAGSISRLYDFSGLIKALEILNKMWRAASLTIITSDQGAKTLKRLVPGNVSFLRFERELPRELIAERVRQATALVVPLAFQVPGLSLKAIEAMALNVPVIISNPGERAIFRDGETCAVVSDNSPHSWQEAILRVATPEYRERIVRGGRAEVEAFRAGRNSEILLRLLEARRW